MNYQDDISDTEYDTNEDGMDGQDEDMIEQTLEQVEAHENTTDEDNSSLESSASERSINNQPFGMGVSVDEDKEHLQKKMLRTTKLNLLLIMREK
eukprot:12343872-Ditylum_brightwellii.AAC.1